MAATADQGVRFTVPSHQGQAQTKQQDDDDLRIVRTMTGRASANRADLNKETEEELDRLKHTLRNNIQSSRAQHHNFELVSLPNSAAVSRVCLFVVRHLQMNRHWLTLPSGTIRLWSTAEKNYASWFWLWLKSCFQRGFSYAIAQECSRALTTSYTRHHTRWRRQGCSPSTATRSRYHHSTAIRVSP